MCVNIVAAFLGMHVCLRNIAMCDYRTDTRMDGQTDAGQSASQATQKVRLKFLSTDNTNNGARAMTIVLDIYVLSS